MDRGLLAAAGAGDAVACRALLCAGAHGIRAATVAAIDAGHTDTAEILACWGGLPLRLTDVPRGAAAWWWMLSSLDPVRIAITTNHIPDGIAAHGSSGITVGRGTDGSRLPAGISSRECALREIRSISARGRMCPSADALWLVELSYNSWSTRVHSRWRGRCKSWGPAVMTIMRIAATRIPPVPTEIWWSVLKCASPTWFNHT